MSAIFHIHEVDDIFWMCIRQIDWRPLDKLHKRPHTPFIIYGRIKHKTMMKCEVDIHKKSAVK